MPPLPVSLRDLLEMSQFVGNTPYAHKLNWKNKTYVFAGSWYGSVCRWFQGESAMYTVHQVQRVSDRMVDAIVYYTNTRWDKEVRSSAENLIVGVENLRKTYEASMEVESTLKISALNIRETLKNGDDGNLVTTKFYNDASTVAPSALGDVPFTLPTSRRDSEKDYGSDVPLF